MKIRHTIVVLMAVLIGMLTGTPCVTHGQTLEGITAPNSDVTLSFVLPGRVSEVLVKAGTNVEKNQPLVHLYDEPEQIQCEQLKMLSEDKTKVLAASAELSQKKADLKKVKQAQSKGAASDWEVEHLRLNVRIAQLSLKTALVEQEQYRRRYAHSKSQLTRMRLEAPLPGLVEEVNVEVGESIGALGPVLRIVQNDPLWIDVPVPVDQALDLAIGQDVWVQFPGDANADVPPNGRIIHKSAVADAASETLQIRIEVPNPLKRPAGERVAVAFTPEKKDNVNARLDVK